MPYAHAVIETEDARYERGDEVPADLPDIDELRDSGAVSDDEYDPAADKNEPPATIEIDGVTYVKEQPDA